jgi:hypothetical protein
VRPTIPRRLQGLEVGLDLNLDLGRRVNKESPVGEGLKISTRVILEKIIDEEWTKIKKETGMEIGMTIKEM